MKKDIVEMTIIGFILGALALLSIISMGNTVKPSAEYCQNLYMTPTTESQVIFEKIGCDEEKTSEAINRIKHGDY